MPPMKITAKVAEQDRHLENVATLLFHNGFLYSGGDDGKIKMWSADLKLQAEVQAHPVNIYSFVADQDTLYSCSNDGAIKSWSLSTKGDTKEIKFLNYVKKECDDEVVKLRFNDGKLYAGDSEGGVTVYKNGKRKGVYETLEEIKDMEVFDNLLYTASNNYLTITEMTGPKMSYVLKKSVQGRCPVVVTSQRLCFSSRDGRCILIYDNTKGSTYEELGMLPAHEMVMMALCVSGNGRYVFSGGYDRVVKRWDIKVEKPGTLPCDGEQDVDQVISSLCAGDNLRDIYVGGAHGYLCRVEAA